MHLYPVPPRTDRTSSETHTYSIKKTAEAEGKNNQEINFNKSLEDRKQIAVY